MGFIAGDGACPKAVIIVFYFALYFGITNSQQQEIVTSSTTDGINRTMSSNPTSVTITPIASPTTITASTSTITTLGKPSSTSRPTSTPQLPTPYDRGSLPVAIVAGATVGGLAVLLLVALGVATFVCCCRHRRLKERKQSGMMKKGSAELNGTHKQTTAKTGLDLVPSKETTSMALSLPYSTSPKPKPPPTTQEQSAAAINLPKPKPLPMLPPGMKEKGKVPSTTTSAPSSASTTTPTTATAKNGQPSNTPTAKNGQLSNAPTAIKGNPPTGTLPSATAHVKPVKPVTKALSDKVHDRTAVAIRWAKPNKIPGRTHPQRDRDSTGSEDDYEPVPTRSVLLGTNTIVPDQPKRSSQLHEYEELPLL